MLWLHKMKGKMKNELSCGIFKRREFEVREWRNGCWSYLWHKVKFNVTLNFPNNIFCFWKSSRSFCCILIFSFPFFFFAYDSVHPPQMILPADITTNGFKKGVKNLCLKFAFFMYTQFKIVNIIAVLSCSWNIDDCKEQADDRAIFILSFRKLFLCVTRLVLFLMRWWNAANK